MNIPTYQDLYNLAYVPASWTCPKCGFVLHKSTISAQSGEIGTTETDRQSEPCPNDGEWLEPTTYKTVSEQLTERVRQMFNDKKGSITVSELVALAHGNAKTAGWHDTPRDKGTFLMLMVSEIAEAMEGERRNLADDKLPHRRMAEVEMADCVIRIADYCGLQGYDLQSAILEKMAYNQTREDHKREVRDQAGGKAF